MARAAGISLRSVQRIWQAHQLQPHAISYAAGVAIAASLDWIKSRL
jgi:hypothetical protein